MELTTFILSHLPRPPATVLEVGCGKGELTVALDDAGYDATGIDPVAPEGRLFRSVRLEDYSERISFDAVVAARSLHHVEDLDAALDKIVTLLPPGGRVILDEMAWDRFDDDTASWYFGQLRTLAAAGVRDGAPPSLEACRHRWDEEHEGLHGFTAMREALDARFDVTHFSWEPFLYHTLGGVASADLERTLIDAGAIRATGFRYVGERR